MLLRTHDLWKFSIVVLWLYFTNPDYADFKSHSASFKDILGFLKLSFKSLMVGDQSSNYYIFSIIRQNGFVLGISGFWILPQFWTSLSGVTLLGNLVVNAFLYKTLMVFYWFEILASSLFYCWIMDKLERLYFHSEQELCWFLLFSFIFSNLLSKFCFRPLNLFHDRSNPSSQVYAVASAALSCLAAANSPVLVWGGLSLDPVQCALALVTVQALLGHEYGFAGSLTGFSLQYFKS